MALNSLCLGTDGALKRGITKAVLVLGVSGMLNFGTPPPIQSNITSEITGGGYQETTRRQFNEQDEQEILLICEAFLICH